MNGLRGGSIRDWTVIPAFAGIPGVWVILDELIPLRRGRPVQKPIDAGSRLLASGYPLQAALAFIIEGYSFFQDSS
jgi:hypothetical protein